MAGQRFACRENLVVLRGIGLRELWSEEVRHPSPDDGRSWTPHPFGETGVDVDIASLEVLRRGHDLREPIDELHERRQRPAGNLYPFDRHGVTVAQDSPRGQVVS